MEKKSYIYGIFENTSTETVCRYVGQTVNPTRRKWEHFSGIKNTTISALIIANPEAFSFEIIKDFPTETEQSIVDEEERFWIDKYRDTIVNEESGGKYSKRVSEETRRKLSEAGKGREFSEEHKKKIGESHKGEKHPFYGKHLPEETRLKISKAHAGANNFMYGKHHTEEARRKMSEAAKGRTISEETRRKMSEANKGEKNYWYGKHLSEETRKKLSEARKGTKYSDKTKAKKSIPVVCIETEEYFYGAAESMRRTGVHRDAISKCCKGKQKTAGGFHWRYATPEEIEAHKNQPSDMA